jgi:hypothetical protein
MFDQISLLPVPVQITVVIGNLFLLGFILYIGAKFGLKFRGKGFALSFGNEKDENNSPHSKCKNSHDAIECLKDVRKIESDIYELKYQKLMKRQMDFVESASKEGVSKLLRIYTSLLKRKGQENPIKTESCQSYILILKVLETRITDLARFFMKENHLAEKSEPEFESYIESRTNDIRFLVTDTLNDLYYYDRDITRAELYDINEDQFPDFIHIIRECFIKCRMVGFDIQRSVKELENQVEAIFLRFMP